MSVDTLNFVPDSGNLVEGIARVVRVTPGQVWLEPEQTTSCGNCASAARCGGGAREAAGLGTVTSRLQARRFVLDQQDGVNAFREGDRLVVGVSHRALLQAALTAYGVPLVFALFAGSIVQGIYGEDGMTILGVLAGLFFGLVMARLNARRLSARGGLAPRFLRHARSDETCGTL